MSPLNNIRIVLIKPLYGGNLGSICRAMMNMGISDLAIVKPRDDFDWAEARKMAMHAKTILDSHRQFDNTVEAIADCGMVAATSARVGFYRDHSGSPRELAGQMIEAASTQLVAQMAVAFPKK